MKINHTQTKNKIINIADVLREQARYAKNYRQKRDALLTDDTYSAEYRQQKIDELMTAYNEKYNETKEKVIELLNDILSIEQEQESILEYDVPEFANTLAAINAAQSTLPVEVIENIKINFAGQYQVLNTIKNALERNGITTSKYGYDEYTTSVQSVMWSLIPEAENIEQDEISTIVSLNEIFKKIIRFGEVRGIVFTEEEKTFGDGVDDEARDIMARRAMGLEV